MKNYKYATVISIGSIIYAIYLLTNTSLIRIVEPPATYLLVAVMVITSILLLMSIGYGRKNSIRALYSILTGSWGWITILYASNVYANGGWILTGIIAVVLLVSLWEGDWHG